MDTLAYILGALKPLNRKLYRRHQILISDDDVSIGSLSESECPFIDLETAPDLPALAAKIPAFLEKYGIDYPPPP